MAKVTGADGREYWMHIQAGWTTYAEEQELYREAWLDLMERVRSLFGSLGLALRQVELIKGDEYRKLAGTPWRERNFAKMVSQWESGKMTFAGAVWTVPRREPTPKPHPIVGQIPYPSGVSALVAFRNPAIEGPAYPDYGDPSRGSHVRVSVATWYLTPEEEDAVAEALASWLVPVAERTNAVWAHVTSDTQDTTYGTPYETLQGLGNEGAYRAAEHPRGYYWANLLNPTHIARLGGLDQITPAADTAGLLLEPVPRQDGELRYALLRIPDGISSYTDDQLRAVRDLLAPTLLTRELLGWKPYSRNPGDQPLRIIDS